MLRRLDLGCCCWELLLAAAVSCCCWLVLATVGQIDTRWGQRCRERSRSIPLSRGRSPGCPELLLVHIPSPVACVHTTLQYEATPNLQGAPSCLPTQPRTPQLGMAAKAPQGKHSFLSYNSKRRNLGLDRIVLKKQSCMQHRFEVKSMVLRVKSVSNFGFAEPMPAKLTF